MTLRNEEVEPTLARLREQFAAGDIAGARRALLQLSPPGRSQLEARLGTCTVDRMMRTSRGVRAPSQGRVVVLHGIMGGRLSTIDERNDEDHVWINYFRLVAGRIGRFALDQHAQPADARWRVVTSGLLDEYLPLVLELSQRWQVLPVAFDWRLDIDRSAERLDSEIRRWAGGEPVHIVAHSMGGLVARRFMQRFPGTWATMQDADGLKRGGRLVMLGTPNRGSFAIAFVLTGMEKLVRWLERFDLQHDMGELLDIINTFPGSYQMLPTPELAFQDDRLRLYDSATWGGFPVPQAYLDLGRRFQQELHAVQDPHRLLYVAGYGQPTPYRIRVDQPGRFSYQETLDGDGRVPHELGLLPQVPTWWVEEVHGDLPANEHVMAALHDLLATGETRQLESARPVVRAVRGPAPWRAAEEIAPLPPALPARSRAAIAAASPEEAAAAEATIAASFAGSAEAGALRDAALAAAAAPAGAAPRAARKTRAKTPPAITVDVLWADILRSGGDVVAAGHYEGVEPEAGELALDKAVSGIAPGAAFTPDDLVITSHTRRGILRGALGDINFFPWWASRRTVAIAGMGHPGTFGVQALRRTARSLAESVGALKGVRTVNTLLIGSGHGNLDVGTAVGAMLQGLGDAVAGGLAGSSVRRLRIVEFELRKAQQIAEALAAAQAAGQVPPGLRVVETVQDGQGGRIGDEIAMAAILLATAWRVRGKSAAARRAARQVLQGVEASQELRRSCDEVLRRLGESERGDVLARAGALNLGRRRTGTAGTRRPPTRVSFVRDAQGIRAAAISESAVVAERMMAVDWALVDEIIQRLTDPEDAELVTDLGGLMARLFVPSDFRDRLGVGDRLIVEVDRDTGRIHWEMMESFRPGAGRVPLGLDQPLARQLRTSYSPPPLEPAVPSPRLRALVIGDPGDPAQGLALEGARQEALDVAALLRARGVEVDLRIGALNVPRTGPLRGTEPATLLGVLRLLDKHSYDILHFAGHGDFDPADPERRAGWIFGDRFLTARELARVNRVPSLVVANACLSSLTSNLRASADAAAPRSRLRGLDDDLLPGLVDEFFRRGVRNYVGTAWPVSDAGAVLFSEVFYGSLLPAAAEAAPATLGEALLRARLALKREDAAYGALWAAYQHYGDPSMRLRETQPHAAPRPPGR
jgi:hypothetical protein